MTKSILFALTSLVLVASCSAVGTTGQDTSFERVGALNCAEGSQYEQSLVNGTAANPVRCGPQSQPLQ